MDPDLQYRLNSIIAYRIRIEMGYGQNLQRPKGYLKKLSIKKILYKKDSV